MENAGSDEDRLQLGVTALNQLEVCRRTGFLPGHALLVESLVYYFLGDMETALPALEEGKKWLRERGYRLPRATSSTEVQVIRSKVMEPGALRDSPAGARMAMLGQDDLEAAWRENPTEPNRRALGIFLIRNGDPEWGRGLILNEAMSIPEAIETGEITNEDLCLALEAERALGDLGAARYYLTELTGGNDEIPGDSQVWALVGFICLDHGDLVGGRLALEKASELDPENYGLKQQLARLKHKERK